MLIQLNGQKLSSLLDTGCEVSIVGRRVAPGPDLESTNRKLFAGKDYCEIPHTGH